MKKIFAVGMSALILAGACAFAACGDKKVAVDLRGKEYTFSSAETWSYCIQYASGDPDTPIDNPEQWLADNWNLLSNESDKVDFETGEQRTPAQLIAYYKGIINGNAGFLKGATVTISETTRTEGEKFYCTATVVSDGQTLAEKEVCVGYSDYYKGYIAAITDTGDPDDSVQFEIVDFDAETGKINEATVRVTKPLENGGFIYENKTSIAINLKSTEFFCIRCEYRLASVTALT